MPNTTTVSLVLQHRGELPPVVEAELDQLVARLTARLEELEARVAALETLAS